MDAQRLQNYLNLIDLLLTCPSGEEEAILQAHSELIDARLVQVMEQVATQLADESDQNAAEFLREVAAQLTALVNNSSPEESLHFLREILLAIIESNADSQAVYPLLQENLDKLNDRLTRILQALDTSKLPEAEQEKASCIMGATIGNFSNLIQDFPLGNRANNLEIAISGYELVLTVFTRDRFPEQWATVQNGLGNAYRERIRGERADNLEKAIHCYEQALLEYTRSRFPQEWAGTQNNLSNAYCERIRGQRAENIEQALHCYKEALLEYPRSRFPQDWAMTKTNMGNAYCERIRGERAENLEKAIHCYEQALLERTRSGFPQDWADTQNNLGNAYRNRIRGERAENLEKAIHCYEQALLERTRSRFPQDWAGSQNNLGFAYYDRIRGERTENLEQAIHCYEQALLEYTRERFPEQWAMVQNNLGLAYRDQGQIFKAIESFQAALEIYTPSAFPLDCLRAGCNLGDTAFNAGLWETAIAGYALAIDAVEQSRSWATDEERRQEILAESIDVYQKMVQACINNGQLDKALEYVERSRSKRLVDLMASNDLYQDGNIPEKVQAYLLEYEALQHQINQIRFSDNTSSNRELVGASPGTRNRASLEADNERIKALEAQKQQVRQKLSQHDPVSAGLVQVSAPNLAAMQALIDQPTTALLSFYTTSSDTYIFVLRHNQFACHACTGQGLETLQLWIFDQWLIPYMSINLTTDETEQDKRRSAWQSQIPTLLSELAQRLQLSELLKQYLEDAKELILVPHLFLHQIPFAALPTGNGQFLGEKFLIRHVPSCQVLQFCQNRESVGEALTYGTVEDATEDLPCANFEGSEVAKLYNIPEDQRLRGRAQAKVSNYRQLVQQVNVILSSHHAQSRLDNPLESMLVLADGAITLGQLLTPGWRLRNLSDVFLSCCETGLGLTPNLTDEILTLATGFLCAGARSVVSTLWAVDDLATALFSIFYHQHRKQFDRPTALQLAQKQLQNLTGAELATHYQPEIEAMLDKKFEEAEVLRQEAEDQLANYTSGSSEYLKWEQEHDRYAKVATRIDDAIARLKALCKQPFPFQHPIYWAAFICQGLR